MLRPLLHWRSCSSANTIAKNPESGRKNMNPVAACEHCGSRENLMRCSRCRQVWYCGKDHQKCHWKNHKEICVQRATVTPEVVNLVESLKPKSNIDCQIVEQSANFVPLPFEGSSEIEILNAVAEVLSPDFLDSLEKEFAPELLLQHEMPYLDASGKVADVNMRPPFLHRSLREQGIIDQVSKTVIKDMDLYGICVVDNFLGMDMGVDVLDEVLDMYSRGLFKDGQLVSTRNANNDKQNIRSDKIAWCDGKESYCKTIGQLISRVDAVITRANQSMSGSKLGEHIITGRTKAMLACYPGLGTNYVKHVDNPNRDGRCITAIYYLNQQWNIKEDGGLLRIFPEWSDQVADIEPLFDRILFFWSDRRNPHEVQPAYRTRYAITLWYFDAEEREEACRRFQKETLVSLT